MDVFVISIPAQHIVDWASFHDVFQEALGFPNFYGRNMNAWIDCMSCVDDAESGMSNVAIPTGTLLALRIDEASDLKARCPEQFEALLECTASVNFRRVGKGDQPVLALVLSGAPPQ